jgi:hypothetical protein
MEVRKCSTFWESVAHFRNVPHLLQKNSDLRFGKPLLKGYVLKLDTQSGHFLSFSIEKYIIHLYVSVGNAPANK